MKITAVTFVQAAKTFKHSSTKNSKKNFHGRKDKGSKDDGFLPIRPRLCDLCALWKRQDNPGRSNILKGGYLVDCPFGK
jgi:hypothetical protein